ncbi:hypothetical protein [Caproicibacter sp.]|uniref:hypothetical protein n=1 Tax=Caproicibacter sp. TaxID=2814884 RepID=UPI00398977B3
MYSDSRAPVGTLEYVRRNRGINACKRRFQEIIGKQKEAAPRLLNDEGLRFATLFSLKPQIEEAGLNDRLSEKIRAALQICDKVLEEKKALPGGGISYTDENVHAAFLWIFQTGAENDGMSDDYDEILDLSASVLTRRYRETSILPGLAALIFRRNRKKGYLHDLIWAFFQSHDPNALRYLAPYLRSANARDRELAHLLLHLPDIGADSRRWETQYRNFMKWLQDNSPYLYFTGESLQSSNQPEICGLDREAKYLCKQISPRKRTPVDPLTSQEEESLSCFAQAEESDQAVLSDYSKALHASNPESWNRWIHLPVEEQLRLAKNGTGRRLV